MERCDLDILDSETDYDPNEIFTIINDYLKQNKNIFSIKKFKKRPKIFERAIRVITKLNDKQMLISGIVKYEPYLMIPNIINQINSACNQLNKNHKFEVIKEF